MAANIVDISILSPFQWTILGYANPIIYNTKYRDNYQYPDTISDLYAQQPYLQPWELTDILPFQILSNYAPHQLILEDCQGNQIDTFAFVNVPSSIETTGQKAYQATVALNIYPEGVYRFVIKSGSPVLQTYVGNYFDLQAKHPHTMLFEVTNNENDHEYVFETGIVAKLRVYGEIREFQPVSDRTLFIDQPRNIVQLQGKAYYTETLIIGDEWGVPDFIIEKINQLFLCSKVLIDGKQYVGSDGAKFEGTREDLYPMTGWAFEIRPAKANSKKRFEVNGNQNSPLTVVYRIQSRGFGSITGTASTNVILVTEILP
jgi:hypothetical protein